MYLAHLLRRISLQHRISHPLNPLHRTLVCTQERPQLPQTVRIVRLNPCLLRWSQYVPTYQRRLNGDTRQAFERQPLSRRGLSIRCCGYRQVYRTSACSVLTHVGEKHTRQGNTPNPSRPPRMCLLHNKRAFQAYTKPGLDICEKEDQNTVGTE